MGNKCSCFHSQSTDEAEDALLGNESQRHQQQGHQQQVGESHQQTTGRQHSSRAGRLFTMRPRGPPPPYQQVNPFVMLTEEQRLALVSRITLIQMLPVGTYESPNDEKMKLPLSPSPLLPQQEKEKEPSTAGVCEKPDKSENIRECPICMNEFQQGDPIRLLPCMHYYHTRCIDEWLVRSITCPNCMERVDVAFQQTSGNPRQRGGQVRSPSRAGSAAGGAAGIPPLTNHPNNPTNRTSSRQVHAPFAAGLPPPPPPPPISLPAPLPNQNTTSSAAN